MNRLRTHFADQQAQIARRRLQGDIVRDYRDDIVELIKDDGATLSEVALAVRAHGEPVLDHGFKAEILKQIGTVKSIRSGCTKAGGAHSMLPLPGSSRVTATPRTMPTLRGTAAQNLSDDEDDDELFAARRPRG